MEKNKQTKTPRVLTLNEVQVVSGGIVWLIPIILGIVATSYGPHSK